MHLTSTVADGGTPGYPRAVRVAGLMLVWWVGCGGASAPPDVLAPGVVFRSSGNPFELGPLEVTQRDLREGELGAPKPVRLTAPRAASTYPVVQFQHGFLTDRRAYDELLTQLASHGFVVVAPQMYPADGVPLGKEGAPDEARDAAAVAIWAQTFAASVMGSAADPRPLGVAGHSRGGKVTWWLAAQERFAARAIAGVDPVDGRGGPLLSAQPEALPQPVDNAPASLVIGMGLGGACAPAPDGYRHFFERTTPPSTLLVVANQGHADMLDADVDLGGLCAVGPRRAETVRFTGGALAAFFRWTLQDDEAGRRALEAPTTDLEVTRETR